jgi:hypothetical protein
MSRATQAPTTELTHLTRIAMRMLLAQFDLVRDAEEESAGMEADVPRMRALASKMRWSLEDLLMGVRLVAQYETLLWQEDLAIDADVQQFVSRCMRDHCPARSSSGYRPSRRTPQDRDGEL